MAVAGSHVPPAITEFTMVEDPGFINPAVSSCLGFMPYCPITTCGTLFGLMVGEQQSPLTIAKPVDAAAAVSIFDAVVCCIVANSAAVAVPLIELLVGIVAG